MLTPELYSVLRARLYELINYVGIRCRPCRGREIILHAARQLHAAYFFTVDTFIDKLLPATKFVFRLNCDCLYNIFQLWTMVKQLPVLAALLQGASEDEDKSYQPTSQELEAMDITDGEYDSDTHSGQRTRQKNKRLAIPAPSVQQETVREQTEMLTSATRIVAETETAAYTKQFENLLQTAKITTTIEEVTAVMRNFSDAATVPLLAGKPYKKLSKMRGLLRYIRYGTSAQLRYEQFFTCIYINDVFFRYPCLHAGKYDGKVIENGKKHKKTRTMRWECTAVVNWKWSRTDERYELSGREFRHNHEINPSLYSMYKKNRLLTPANIDKIVELSKLQVKSDLIADKLSELTNKHITPKQCRNIIQCHRKQNTEAVVDPLDHALAHYKELDPNCAIVKEVFSDKTAPTTNDDGKLRCLCIVTTTMRETMQETPNTIVVDTTYNTNAERYAMLALIAVHHATGRSVPVGIAFLASENTETVKLAVGHIRDIHGSCWNSIRYVLSDRDWPTLCGLDFATGADARIFLCRYHVNQAVFRNIHKVSERKGESKNEARKLIFRMINAQTEAAYKEAYAVFVETFGSQHDIVKWWRNHWHGLAELVCDFGRIGCLFLNKGTTGRVERFFLEFKLLLGVAGK